MSHALLSKQAVLLVRLALGASRSKIFRMGTTRDMTACTRRRAADAPNS